MRSLMVSWFYFSSLLLSGWGVFPAAVCVAQTKEPAFTFEDFQNLLANEKPASVAEAIRLFPPSFRQKAVLITDSGSLQVSSSLNPRIVFYGAGDFAITFNGSPAQQGFETMETVRFDAASHGFTFEEFVFPKDLAVRRAFVVARLAAHDPAYSSFDLDELEKREGRRGPNPALCLQCHESGAHPLLPAFPEGPGLIGGYNGLAQAPEWLPALAKNLATNERYRASPELAELLGNALASGAAQREFNALLASRNWERVAATLRRAGPAFALYRRSLYAALAGCPQLKKLLPTQAKPWEGKLKVDPAPGRAPLNEEEEGIRLGNVRAVVEDGMEFLMAENFSTSVGFESYDFRSALGGVEALLPALSRQDPLAGLVVPFTPGYCESFR